MGKHKYVDKERLVRERKEKSEEWKWVFHIKPEKAQRYSRFWRPKRE